MLNKKHFQELVEQVCEAWEIESPDVKFLEYKYMETTLGIAFPGNKTYRNHIWVEHDLIVINEILLHYPFNKIMQVIYHELAHLFTRKTDNDYEFELFCKLNNIPLSGDWLEEIVKEEN